MRTVLVAKATVGSRDPESHQEHTCMISILSATRRPKRQGKRRTDRIKRVECRLFFQVSVPTDQRRIARFLHTEF